MVHTGLCAFGAYLIVISVLITLPRAVTPRLLEFCRSISDEKPIYITSRPASDAKPGHCFDNVETKISRAGGGVAYGWAIWHLRGLYFEAEHHGVWKKRTDVLVDVSPQANGYPKILFLPDPLAVYDPLTIRDNLFEPDSVDLLALEFVSLARRRTAIYNSYRIGGATVAMFSNAHRSEIDWTVARMQQIIGIQSLG